MNLAINGYKIYYVITLLANDYCMAVTSCPQGFFSQQLLAYGLSTRLTLLSPS